MGKQTWFFSKHISKKNKVQKGLPTSPLTPSYLIYNKTSSARVRKFNLEYTMDKQILTDLYVEIKVTDKTNHSFPLL